MSPITAPFHAERIPAARPIWRETFAGLDWLALKTSPVYYGFGVPRGNKSAVILVPGFLGTDHYLYEMYYWLRRIAYKPYLSNIGWNAECLNTLVERLSVTIAKAQQETGQKVHLIGHSLGGVLSRAVTILNPAPIASVFTLGSPIRGIRSHPLVLQTADRVREKIMGDRQHREERPDCYTGFCNCPAVTAMHNHFPHEVKKTAIYTKTDGIVDWQVCLTDDPAKNFEVTGTHVGLAFNPTVYAIIAKRLAETAATRKA
jgi:pimeloyl-ACP methyl ester carboxylesterase